jgi:hypothetical protein
LAFDDASGDERFVHPSADHPGAYTPGSGANHDPRATNHQPRAPNHHPRAPSEILAENTTEALRVVRVGDWVYKYLKPPVCGGWEQARDYLRYLRFRAFESRVWPELNPHWFLPRRRALFSRFVSGRPATFDETRRLAWDIRASGRGYLQDLTASNVRVVDGRFVVIDFHLAEQLPDWRRRLASLPHRFLESVSCR